MQIQLISAGEGRRVMSAHWRECKDGDETALAFYNRHYSRRAYADGRIPELFVGPGRKLVLITECARAVFAWRKFIDDSGQTGVNCAVFRNEGAALSSTLIREADAIAFAEWPGERHYTYVDPKKVKGANPGACFIAAGWKRCGVTKVNKLLVLELLPA